MNTISGYLSADHVRCDTLFAQLETSASRGAWERADMDLDEFMQALERHFAMEEKVLFEAFEDAIGSCTGPTSIMRLEHQHIRGIVARLAEATRRRDTNDFFDRADTLRIMMEQHNLKEESVLYMMTDRTLSGQRDELIETMAALGTTGATHTGAAFDTLDTIG